MTTTVMDPALRKLLDELPLTDPDQGPQERAEIWAAFAPGRVTIPVGQWVRIELGPWGGPEMRLADVILQAKILSSGQIRRGRIDDPQDQIVRLGARIRAVVFVKP